MNFTNINNKSFSFYPNNNDDFSIREASFQDIDSILDIHLLALPDSLLVRLGRSYLKKRLYPFALRSKDVNISVLEKENNILGFSIFCRNKKNITNELFKYKWSIIKSLVKKVWIDPKIVMHCFAGLKGKSSVWTDKPRVPYFYLFLIAINPQKHGTGYGTILLEESLLSSVEQFGKGACLVDTRTIEAFNFYIKNNFKEIGQEIRGSRKFFKLFKEINNS